MLSAMPLQDLAMGPSYQDLRLVSPLQGIYFVGPESGAAHSLQGIYFVGPESGAAHSLYPRNVGTQTGRKPHTPEDH